ncbi:RNA polymerase sigma factor [Streptomyces sp. MK37H]|uniref:RNA polymerase sigma factor n=1 Tax=Streptomyces sp. MK37H TaxID=2699117 RepID=UPI001B394952|nr:RNA polymerase sigma factor [Streptomyces sp. MK37H]MBP8532851.1 sigma-70 family RNA polymerase sigma factor [Streptomyces sp. MK37H]
MELSLRDRIRAGDPAAFTELFGAHARAVYSHAARLTGDRDAAEDVVSLTFLEAWRLREKVRPDAAAFEGDGQGDGLRPWLYGVATNVLRNTRRAARRHSAALARLPDRPADHDTVPDFADELVGRLENAERLAAARTALGRLRRSEREVFALCVWSGLSYAAAGEALGVPASTVRSRLSRARQRLRRLAEAELARPASGRRPPDRLGPPSVPESGDIRANPEKPRLRSRTGQVPGGRTEAARSTQEKHR